jgi:hypothetical protein
MRDIKRDIESALVDYRRSMEVLNVVGWTGMKSLSFPVLTTVITKITGHELDSTTLFIVSALGIGIGTVTGLMDWKHKRKKLSRDSDYSYLLHLTNEWKGCAMNNYDYNYVLYDDMDQFIND